MIVLGADQAHRRAGQAGRQPDFLDVLIKLLVEGFEQSGIVLGLLFEGFSASCRSLSLPNWTVPLPTDCRFALELGHRLYD